MSPGSSFTDETQSSELFSKDDSSDDDENKSANDEKDRATTASGKTVKGAFRMFSQFVKVQYKL